MVAERVVVITRRARESHATRWESSGDGTYTVTEAEKATVGTSVMLFLRKPDPETGMEDFTDKWRISRLVKLHSDFINYPITLKTARPAETSGIDVECVNEVKPDVAGDQEALNSMRPLWTRREVTDKESSQFYKHISHDWNDPLIG